MVKLNGRDLSGIRFEAFLFLASALMLVGAFAPWKKMYNIQFSPLSSWHGALVFAGGVIALFAATVSYEFYKSDFLQIYRPYTDGLIGLIGSLLPLLSAFLFIESLPPEASLVWGVYLTIVGASLGLFSAIAIIAKGNPTPADRKRGMPSSPL